MSEVAERPDFGALVRERGVSAIERAMLPQPQADCPVVHHFGPGIYIREVHMAAGVFAVGHHQRFEHVNVLLKGAVEVYEDSGTTTVLRAPLMYVGKPGRKVGLILEDVVWQNIYATTETDVEKLEAMLLDKSAAWQGAQAAIAPNEADREDFAAMLREFGFPAELVRAQSENVGDQMPMPSGAWRFKTGRSAIEGTGVFACAPIQAGEVIGPARVNGMRTPLGRFTNHSARPNARMELTPSSDVLLVAVSDLRGCRGGQDGDEITIDYREALALSGVLKLPEVKV